MSNLRFSFCTIALACLTTAAIAQPFSFNANSKSNGTSAATTNTNAPPLSADAFQKQVNTKAQQAHAETLQQSLGHVKQQVTQMPLPNSAPATSKPIVVPPPVEKSTTDTNTNNDSSEPVPPAAAGFAPAQAAPASQPPAATPAPEAAATPAPTSSAPQQNSTYTGFGGGKTDNNSGTTQSGSGWNIKY